MKKTLKQVQGELADAELVAHKWQEDYYEQRNRVSELQEKLEGKNRLTISGLMEKDFHNEAENRRLTEIIRWLIKPSTAEMELQMKLQEMVKRGF